MIERTVNRIPKIDKTFVVGRVPLFSGQIDSKEEKSKVHYESIREIFSVIDDLDLREKHGGKFYFPIYMTKTLEQTDIVDLELSVRSINCLRRAGIMTIGDLCKKVQSSNDLKKIRNCGITSIAEIMDHLFAYQYHLLKPERRGKYLACVAERNLRPRKD